VHKSVLAVQGIVTLSHGYVQCSAARCAWPVLAPSCALSLCAALCPSPGPALDCQSGREPANQQSTAAATTCCLQLLLLQRLTHLLLAVHSKIRLQLFSVAACNAEAQGWRYPPGAPSFLCSSALNICCWLCTTRYGLICLLWLCETLQCRGGNTRLVRPASCAPVRCKSAAGFAT
jgi:hypothetical protein